MENKQKINLIFILDKRYYLVQGVKGNFVFYTFPSEDSLILFLSSFIPSEPLWIVANRYLSNVIGQLYLDFNRTTYICSPYFIPENFSFSPNKLKKFLSERIYRTTTSTFGGWRPINHDDFFYAGTHTTLRMFPATPISRKFREHTFWVPSKFFTIANEEALARVIGYIGDPRWYIKYRNDGTPSLKRIYDTLGLWRENLYSVIESELDFVPEKYCVLFWYSNSYAYEAMNNIHKFGPDVLGDVPGLLPGDVFYRYLYDELQKEKTDILFGSKPFIGPMRVIYKATKYAVGVLMKLWLSILNASRASEPLFDPAYEFKLECSAFSSFYFPIHSALSNRR